MGKTLRDVLMMYPLEVQCTPIKPDVAWAKDMPDVKAWKVTLRWVKEPIDGQQSRTLTTKFHMGPSHGDTKPTALTVMGCLCSDAADVDSHVNYDDWRRTHPEGEERAAERLWQALVKQNEMLRKFLGVLYGDFVWSRR